MGNVTEAEVLENEFIGSGNALKAVSESDDELRVKNYIILFDSRDLTGEQVDGFGTGSKNADGSAGEYFTKSTAIESVFTKGGSLPIGWEHGQPIHGEPTIPHGLGYVDWKTAEQDENGWLVERILDRRNRFVQAIEPLIKARQIGTSSEATKSMVATDGRIEEWPLKGDTLTVKPFEPRMLLDNPILMKSVKELAEFDSRLKAMLPETDGTSVEQDATADEDGMQESEAGMVLEAQPQVIDVNINVNLTNSNGESEMSTEQVQENKVEEAAKAPANGSDGATQTITPTTPNFDLGENQIKAIATSVFEMIEQRDKQNPVPNFEAAGFAVPNIKKATRRGFSGDEVDTFKHWIRTGDEVAAKAALQEGTDSEGGYLVPNDFLPTIIEKRDELSILRQAGAQTFETNRDVFDVPVENAKMTNFVITAEEGTYDQNEPTFSQKAVTVYKFTKLVKISEELAADEAVGLDAYLSRAFGRAWGLTENQYGLVGTGSGQPEGAFVGGTAGVTAASATAIAVSEIPELYYKLGQQYREGAAWVSSGTTEGILRANQGSEFLFANTPQGSINDRMFWGMKQLYTSESVAEMTTGLKSLLIGNFNFYAIVGRENLVISRNPYLYQGTGQIGLFAKVRMGSAVLQADAFQYLTQA